MATEVPIVFPDAEASAIKVDCMQKLNDTNYKLVVDYSDLDAFVRNSIESADCCITACTGCSTMCTRSTEDELREELKQKDEEIARIKLAARKLEDDAKFERMVRDLCVKDLNTALELVDGLKQKIEYCKKNGIWVEEDES